MGYWYKILAHVIVMMTIILIITFAVFRAWELILPSMILMGMIWGIAGFIDFVAFKSMKHYIEKGL